MRYFKFQACFLGLGRVATWDIVCPSLLRNEIIHLLGIQNVKEILKLHLSFLSFCSSLLFVCLFVSDNPLISVRVIKAFWRTMSFSILISMADNHLPFYEYLGFYLTNFLIALLQTSLCSKSLKLFPQDKLISC